MRFLIRWPDGTSESCYSPSRVIEDYLAPGKSYALPDFLALSRIALTAASDRVKAKYGKPCSRALVQLARIEAAVADFAGAPDASVTVDAFQSDGGALERSSA
jgi:uncharacterized repeat protein (TIGR04042 family)